MDTREDQVARMQQLLEAHPYLEITHFRHPMWHFRCIWFDAGLRREITAGELGDLIDLVLDALNRSSPRR
jgi:hypothetical protein